MAAMSMNKVIHGAFRRDLHRFVKALAAFPPGNRPRARQLAAAWANFDHQLTRHHEGEHEIAWPALESMGLSHDLLAQMDVEHDTMAVALSEARTAMSALLHSASGVDAVAAHKALQHLQDVTVAHLDHEEAEIEAFYLAHEDDPAMKEMGRKFSKGGPAEGGQFIAWLTDGASRDEVAALKANIPGPVMAIVGGIFGRGYRKNVAPAWQSPPSRGELNPEPSGES